MNAILKKVGKPPEWVTVTSRYRIDAVKEILGVYVAPVFFSQSITNSFFFTYDGNWQLPNSKINFFATVLRMKDYPVTPIYGDVLFLRTKMISGIPMDFVDFEVANCSEADMKFLQTQFLKNSTQHRLYKEYNEIVQKMWHDQAVVNANATRVTNELTEWKNFHLEEPKDCILGESIDDKIRIPKTTGPELKKYILNEESFAKYCKMLGVQYVHHSNMVMIRTKVSLWRIFRQGCYVTQLSHENYLTERAKSLGYTIPRAGFHLHDLKSRNIFHVTQNIASHDEWRWMQKQRTNSST